MSLENRLLVKACIEKINPRIEEVSRLFYKALFQLDYQMESVFPGNVVFLNRKFINMMATFKNVKHLESIQDSIAKMGQRHAAHYGVKIQHFPILKRALEIALANYLKQDYTHALQQAWSDVFDEVAGIMQQAMAQVETTHIAPIKHDASGYDSQLLAEIGGTAVVFAVHQRFYDRLFVEPWLETFFFGKSKAALIEKQTHFMVAAFGGENHYNGDTPAFVHMHMFITEEMADVRETILRAAILEQGLSASIAARWLKVDRAFRPAIVKQALDECVLKCPGQFPVVAKKPVDYQPPLLS